MTADEALNHIRSTPPASLYISGKTSTGKSTFAAKIKEIYGYEIVELDKIVIDAVIKPFGLTDEGQAFVEVYRLRNHLDWIKRFVAATHQTIANHQKIGKKIVIDGAIGNSTTLQELLEPFPGTTIFYFHPKNLTTYEQYLTSRFLLTKPDFRAGLPSAFWQLIDKKAFQQFCVDRVITAPLRRSITQYAALSQAASAERLNEFRPHFSSLEIVEI